MHLQLENPASSDDEELDKLQAIVARVSQILLPLGSWWDKPGPRSFVLKTRSF